MGEGRAGTWAGATGTGVAGYLQKCPTALNVIAVYHPIGQPGRPPFWKV